MTTKTRSKNWTAAAAAVAFVLLVNGAVLVLAAGGQAATSTPPATPATTAQVDAMAKRIDDLERARNLLLGLFGLNLLGIPAAYVALLRKARKRVEEGLEKMIESRPGALLQMIDEADRAGRLRRETGIGIVSADLALQRVLFQQGFRSILTAERDGWRDLDADAERLVLVLDCSSGFDGAEAAAKWVDEVMERSTRDRVLIFFRGRLMLAQPQRAIFANSEMSLFSRLVELIEFETACAGFQAKPETFSRREPAPVLRAVPRSS